MNKEILTKVIATKSKENFIKEYIFKIENEPSTILGVWVINHQFNCVGLDSFNAVIKGSFDVNVWYSYEYDSKTKVFTKKIDYTDNIALKNYKNKTGDETIIRSLEQPTCIETNIVDSVIKVVIKNGIGVEVIQEQIINIKTGDINE